jgi:hypothetical protein
MSNSVETDADLVGDHWKLEIKLALNKDLLYLLC